MQAITVLQRTQGPSVFPHLTSRPQGVSDALVRNRTNAVIDPIPSAGWRPAARAVHFGDDAKWHACWGSEAAHVREKGGQDVGTNRASDLAECGGCALQPALLFGVRGLLGGLPKYVDEYAQGLMAVRV